MVEAVNEHLGGGGFRLLKGIEVDILDDGALDQTDEMLARLDVASLSVHSKLEMEPAAMTRRMVARSRNPCTNVLGHCTGRLVTGNRGTRGQSEFDAEAVFEACAETRRRPSRSTRRPERRDPPTKLLRAGRSTSAACSRSTATPTRPASSTSSVYGCERAEEPGIDPDRIVNTWPRDRLLDWAEPGCVRRLACRP